MHDIREKDYGYLRHALDLIQQFLANDAPQGEEPGGDECLLRWARFLVEVSEELARVSYKKGSIKDRFKDMPWHNIEYFPTLLKECISEECLEDEELALKRSLCKVALPAVIELDLPELLQRLQFIWDEYYAEPQERKCSETSVNRSIVTLPPARGLVNIVKLTGYDLGPFLLLALSPSVTPGCTGTSWTRHSLIQSSDTQMLCWGHTKVQPRKRYLIP